MKKMKYNHKEAKRIFGPWLENSAIKAVSNMGTPNGADEFSEEANLEVVKAQAPDFNEKINSAFASLEEATP